MISQVLIASGLDPSGGAGFLADASVCRALGARPVGVITGHTVQDTKGVRRVSPVDTELLSDQVTVLLSDLEISAVKLGMIGSFENAQALANALDLTSGPLVWDPIARPTLGAPSFIEKPLAEVFSTLSRHISVLTPNRLELALLVKHDLQSITEEDLTFAGTKHSAQEFASANEVIVLVTGIPHEDNAVDLICTQTETIEVPTRWMDGFEKIHGAGCALSTAVASFIAKGVEPVAACKKAIQWVREQQSSAPTPGQGARAIL